MNPPQVYMCSPSWTLLPPPSLQSILVCRFLECWRSLLPSPVWPLPVCLDSWTWHSRFLCNIALYSIGPFFYHQSHPQLSIVFALAPSLHSFWSYFSTDLQKHIGHLLTWVGSSSFSILSFCLFILFMGFSRQEYWSGLPFPFQWTTFCQTSPPSKLPVSGGPTRHGLVSLS